MIHSRCMVVLYGGSLVKNARPVDVTGRFITNSPLIRAPVDIRFLHSRMLLIRGH